MFSPDAGPTASTVGEWIARVEPAPPPALRSRLLELVAGEAGQPVSCVVPVCLGASERMLGALLSNGSTSRASALDLLAIDALVTYAFQAAADSPAHIEHQAADAMIRIAAMPQQ